MGVIDVKVPQDKLDLNGVKKILYKEKPTAKWISNPSNTVDRVYECETSVGKVQFHVPLSEQGETEFTTEMEAQLLIRWIKE